MIKAVIFDMNGVIADDEHIHELAFKQTVQLYGIELTHQDYLAYCAGKTDLKGFEDISQHFAQLLPIDVVLREKSRIYFSLYRENKKLYPGMVELIKELSKHFVLAITSSSSRMEVDMVVKEFGLTGFFPVTISADDVIKGKPDPQPYLITMEKLSVKGNECVIIEDSPSGIKSAKAAGCYCIAVSTTHSKEDLKQADVIVSSHSDINHSLIQNLSYEAR